MSSQNHTLFLMRHAKSDWNDPGQEDMERPLNRRGQKAAGRIAANMRQQGQHPNLILCSTAVRARETLGLMLPSFDGNTKIQMMESLYFARDGLALARILREWGQARKRIMMIGHNPSIQDFVCSFCSRGDQDMRRLAEEKYPTAALAEIRFPVSDWMELQADGELVSLTLPRSLS